MARNGISRRTIGRAGGLAMLWLVLGLIGSNAALAAHSYLWSHPIKTANRGVYGVGGREAVYAANKRHRGLLDTERVFSPDGAVEWEVETEPTTIVPPALASDGSGYVVWVNGGTDVIEAISAAGIVRWSHVLPTGDAVTGLVAGYDGAAYVSVAATTGREVMRLSPADGSVTFATPIPEADYGGGELFAEPSGVAVATATHVLFVSQEGQITADIDPIPSGNATRWWPAGSSTITSNNAGDLFVGSAPGNGNYPLETANGIAVSEVEPSGHVAWTAQTPVNGGAGAATTLAALPDGGVAYDVSSQSVGVLNADGSSRWSTENREGYDGPMLTDGSGHLDLASLVNGATCSDNVKNCGGFHLEQLQAANGQLAHLVSVVSTKDPMYDWFCGGLALGSQMFYVLDDPTAPGPSSCTPAGKPQLQAYALPETAGPYPTPPTTTEPSGQNSRSAYVALGDSYSSGEGDPPYEALTENPGWNVCHRSEAAYSDLLDRELALGPLAFGACSGAVTDDLFTPNTANHEPAQFIYLLPDNTRTVTLTIGGDDMGFVEVLEHCIEGLRLGNPWPYWQGAECSTSQALRDVLSARLNVLGGTSASSVDGGPLIHPLSEVFAAIHAEAPKARIVVGGYPALFGAKGSHYELHPTSTNVLERACPVWPGIGIPVYWVLYSDAKWLNEEAQALDSVIQAAATAAATSGLPVKYAPPAKFKGHGLCDSKEAWVHPLELGVSPIGPEPSSFHTTATGQLQGYEPAFAKALK
jgi:hypothetical protein